MNQQTRLQKLNLLAEKLEAENKSLRKIIESEEYQREKARIDALPPIADRSMFDTRGKLKRRQK